jgi:hypothetical protein
MIYKFIILKFLFLGFPFLIFSRNQKDEFSKDIFTENYKISLSNNDGDFFTGKIIITDIKNNKEVFKADSVYTRYNGDTLVDLNNDGKKELILDLATGATMYDYNMYLIFDFTKNNIEPLEVHNASLVGNIDEVPKIVSYVRLSPAAAGAGYSFSLNYKVGKLILENNINESNVLKKLEPDEKENLYLISEYVKAFNECDKNSEVLVYYEAYLMQKMILGQEAKGWEFFDKNYECKNKKKVRESLRKNVTDSYNFWKSSEFKFGGEGNY